MAEMSKKAKDDLKASIANTMFEAILLLIDARHESSEEFVRVSYTKDVQYAFDIVEEVDKIIS